MCAAVQSTGFSLILSNVALLLCGYRKPLLIYGKLHSRHRDLLAMDEGLLQ